MWPFEYIQTNRVLFNRIKDLERTIESLSGANTILSQELERTQFKENQLLEKIFEITGLSRPVKNIQEQTSKSPIQLGKRVEWPKLKDDLELKARKEYWEKKRQDQETKQSSTIEELEKDLEIN